MGKIELNDPAITQKGIEATIAFYHTMAIDELILPGLNAFVTGIDSPFLNVVIDTRESTENSADIIIIEKFFNQYNLPWAWFVISTANTIHLDQFGYSFLEEVPGMYFNLANPLPTLATDFISIKELNENDNLGAWIEPIHEGFGSSDNGKAFRQLNSNLLKKGEKKFRHFIANDKDQTVASGTLFLYADSVMLHNLATKTAFRKRGIGSALTLYMMKEAQKLELKHCFLDSSEDAFDLYKKLGFLIYCTTFVYTKD